MSQSTNRWRRSCCGCNTHPDPGGLTCSTVRKGEPCFKPVIVPARCFWGKPAPLDTWSGWAEASSKLFPRRAGEKENKIYYNIVNTSIGDFSKSVGQDSGRGKGRERKRILRTINAVSSGLETPLVITIRACRLMVTLSTEVLHTHVVMQHHRRQHLHFCPFPGNVVQYSRPSGRLLAGK